MEKICCIVLGEITGYYDERTIALHVYLRQNYEAVVGTKHL
jgi:hypothetical protein